MQAGSMCTIYKTCKICGKTKHFKHFKKCGKRYRDRTSYCINCQDRSHEIIIPNTIYTFDTLELSEEFIKVRHKKRNGKYRYEYWGSLQHARQLVNEGAAGIVHEKLIHRLYIRGTPTNDSGKGSVYMWLLRRLWGYH